MWEFVDKVIYINLEHRQDRRDGMAKFFEDAKIPLEKVVHFSAIKRSDGALGCAESHMEVMKIAKQNGWKNTLVLEDDLEVFHFEEGYKQLEELVKLPNWDVIMLSGWYWEFNFPRIYKATMTSAYLVNEKYIDTLLKSRISAVNGFRKQIIFKNDRFYADISWFSLQNTDTWYGIEPCLCRQGDGFSDIQKRFIKMSKIIGEGSQKIKKEVYG